MVKQYRIDRFNGLEVLVCEIYRKHLYTQREYEAFHAWKLEQEKIRPNEVYLDSDFRSDLNDWLEAEHSDQESFFGLTDPMPTYDYQPHMVLRGVIVDNRIASLQVDYDGATLSPEVVDAVQKFYNVLDSRHWRDMVSHQIERYGSLFASVDD